MTPRVSATTNDPLLNSLSTRVPTHEQLQRLKAATQDDDEDDTAEDEWEEIQNDPQVAADAIQQVVGSYDFTELGTRPKKE